MKTAYVKAAILPPLTKRATRYKIRRSRVALPGKLGGNAGTAALGITKLLRKFRVMMNHFFTRPVVGFYWWQWRRTAPVAAVPKET